MKFRAVVGGLLLSLGGDDFGEVLIAFDGVDADGAAAGVLPSA